MFNVDMDAKYTTKRFCKDLTIVGGIAVAAGFVITSGLRLLSRIG